MKISPLGSRVVIQPAADTEDKKGSIIIPDTAKKVPVKGTVIEIGGACALLFVGNQVLYSKYAGTEVEFEDKPYIIMLESDVLAQIVEGEWQFENKEAWR